MKIINKKVLISNIFLSLVGQIAPLAAAIFAIPALLEVIGPDRLGLVALAWGVLGYFSLFDLGIGRALTQKVAVHLELGESELISTTLWASLLLLSSIGILGAFFLYMLTPWIVYSILNIPIHLLSEVEASFLLLSLSIPIVVFSSGLRGLLEGLGQFGKVNLVRVPIGILTFLVPLIVAKLNNNLVWVIFSLVLIRIFGLFAQFIYCIKAWPRIFPIPKLRSIRLKSLMELSGWMALSNIMGPFLVYLDRFVVGSVITLSAVSIYVVPYEIVTKLWIIVGSITTVFFPAFAASSIGEREAASELHSWSVKCVFILLLPLTLVIVFVAPELMKFWLGSNFSFESAKVMRWLAVGVFLNSFGQIYFTIIQGMGRPDITAKLYFFELPVYIIAIYFLTKHFGVQGTAICWTFRIIVDTGMLIFYSRKYVVLMPVNIIRLVVPSAFLLTAFFISLFMKNIDARVIVLIITELLLIPIIWFFVLNKIDREYLKKSFYHLFARFHFFKIITNK